MPGVGPRPGRARRSLERPASGQRQRADRRPAAKRLQGELCGRLNIPAPDNAMSSAPATATLAPSSAAAPPAAPRRRRRRDDLVRIGPLAAPASAASATGSGSAASATTRRGSAHRAPGGGGSDRRGGAVGATSATVGAALRPRPSRRSAGSAPPSRPRRPCRDRGARGLRRPAPPRRRQLDPDLLGRPGRGDHRCARGSGALDAQLRRGRRGAPRRPQRLGRSRDAAARQLRLHRSAPLIGVVADRRAGHDQP